MKGNIAIHSTHEAADKLGGIGTVLSGLLSAASYQAAFERSLLVGLYHFPTEGSVIDDLELREAKGWRVSFDSAAESQPASGEARLAQALGELAQRFGVRLVFGERLVARDTRVPVLLASPHGIRREWVDHFRAAVREQHGIDLAAYDGYPALTDRVDGHLARLLDPSGTLGSQRDVPERVIVDSAGRPFPGGAGWAEGRAVLPRIAALDAFTGFAASNKYLLELQYHTFPAPALWAATRAVLGHWAPLARRGYDAKRVTLFAHDWVGVPLFWALTAAGDHAARTVYVAHEARIFRLLAEGALSDRAALLRAVCHPGGCDASLYPYLAQALARGWDLGTMFPGCGGFEDVYHHRFNREARKFDRVVAVGPLVRDELRVMLRPGAERDVALCPNGIPSRVRTVEEVVAGRGRLAAVVERHCGFAPDLIVTAVMRAEMSKAPWRNVGLVRRLAERLAARGSTLACLWLSAPKPRPTRGQVERWRRLYRWPLDHRPAPDGDLRPDETALWREIAALNDAYAGRAALLYINQFGWSSQDLGALDPGDSTFDDLRTGTDLELGLSIYEPFGISPLEPFAAGAVCVLSDACGCARHLESLGLADSVVIGRFTAHEHAPRDVDDTVRRRIEARVYDEIIDEVLPRVGLGNGHDPLSLRAERLARAPEVLRRLSWDVAASDYLLPALK